jgi:hypothetical protein
VADERPTTQELEDRQRKLEAELPPSATAGPVLTADELELKIEQRRMEIEQTPCYRCDHKPVAPDPGCPCCADAHTPNADGDFTLMSAEEFATMRAGGAT